MLADNVSRPARALAHVASVALACSLVFTAPAQAQHEELASLQARLDATSFRAVSVLADSAKANGLPVFLLVSKVQEGLLKRATPPAILAATRALLNRLQQSRGALGTEAGPTELDAGAGALRTGALPAQLTELRSARDGRSIAVPLIVMADLIARGVPRDSAARAMQTLISANATDAAFTTFRQTIERDIASGMPPVVSAGMRSKALLERQALP